MLENVKVVVNEATDENDAFDEEQYMFIEYILCFWQCFFSAAECVCVLCKIVTCYYFTYSGYGSMIDERGQIYLSSDK